MAFKGWNLYVSYSEQQDNAAKKAGYAFLGWAKDYSGREIKIYRMWRMKDGPPDKKRKEK